MPPVQGSELRQDHGVAPPDPIRTYRFAVFLAAWLLDHNDADGQPAAAVVAGLRRTSSTTGELTRDEILDNITLYWLTNTGVSSSRLYWEYKGGFFNAEGRRDPGGRDRLPREQYQAPRSWTEQAYPKLIYYHRSAKAATSRRGSSRTPLRKSFARASGRCADRGKERHESQPDSCIAPCSPPSSAPRATSRRPRTEAWDTR